MTGSGWRLALLFGALLTASSTCVRRPLPHVVVVVIDGLRADRLGAYGSGRRLTPFLDALGHRGTLFRHAFAAATDTAPSVASLLTARYPSQHRVAGREGTLPDAERTLAEALASHDYQAFGFAATNLLPGERGWGQGFRTWSAAARFKQPADELRKRSLRWIDLVRGVHPTKPLFLYLHYMEPCAPYDPPARYRARFVPPAEEGVTSEAARRKAAEMRFTELSPAETRHLAALYDAEVAYLDGELRKLFAGLVRRHLLDDAIVIVVADHGEELGEHALVGHGFTLYDQELHVPLLLLGHGVPAGREADQPVSLVDAAPTVLALAGLPRETSFAGRSLVPLLAGEEAATDVVAELPLPSPRFDPRRHTAALVRGSRRLLLLADAWAARLGEAELYDVAEDPGESRPRGYLGGPLALPEGSPALGEARELLAALRAAEAGLASPAP